MGVTTENYDKGREKLNVHRTLMERIEDVRNAGYADGNYHRGIWRTKKIDDILRYGVDILPSVPDWLGKFDYLKEYQVVYLERTKGVSSTQLRIEAQSSLSELGIIGSGRIANRFIKESKYVAV